MERDQGNLLQEQMQPNEEKIIITLSSGTDVSNPITNTVRD
jgi:hypothetical protein